MAAIELGNGESWTVSRWIFQRVLQEVERLHPEDQELVTALRYGDANDLLSFKFVDQATWGRIQEAMLPATNGILAGADKDERLVRAVADLQHRLTRQPT